MKRARTLLSGTLAVSARFAQLANKLLETTIIANCDNGIVIGTHDGSFHCDEALAVSLLKMLPQYADVPILRTRNPAYLATSSVVVDVGAVYDPATFRFDHHQREFTECLEGYSTKLSSAGLVYKHFGRDILRVLLKEDADHVVDEAFVEICFHKLYKSFIEHIDAIDNGIAVGDSAPRYHISTTLSDRVHELNPAWNEPQTTEVYNERFVQAMHLTSSEFLFKVDALASVWWPARSIVHEAFSKRLNAHSSGQILILESSCPWKDHLFELEKDLNIEMPILYALYADSGGSWRIQAVPVDPNSFQSRKKLPSEWCGLRDNELSLKTGVPGSIFIHANGFIGGHSTREGAIELAVKALLHNS